ncbi:hypothetical protein H0H87_002424, partial [Tephrocybe sp. NHM501043]
DRARYSEFWDALTAGIEKIEAYYEKAADSHAYTFAMLILLLEPCPPPTAPRLLDFLPKIQVTTKAAVKL